MSAHIVNNGWKQLWETYEDPQDEKITLKSIDIKNDDLGYIHAAIGPCDIKFEGSNHSGITVYYFIKYGHYFLLSKQNCQDVLWYSAAVLFRDKHEYSFLSGTLQSSGKSLPDGLDVTGWRICVNVKVEEQKKEEMTKDQLQYIEDNYAVPGDYSIARLFADLSSAYFDSLDADRSTFGTGQNGKPITFDESLDQYEEEYSAPFYAFMST
ncbi:hypothetical protein F4860DRAFT_525704 [Xylaria cubensis]|nr:hypothetical protein F4860DRAFT_525704 [Xylaria cubensis]